MAGDAVWLEVLPELSKFAKQLSGGADKAASAAGKSAGGAFSRLFAMAAGDATVKDQTAKLEKAAKDSERAVESATAGIAKARAAQRAENAKLIEAEQKLADQVEKYGKGSSQAAAASERLEGARERQKEASRKAETAEKQLSAAHEEAKQSAQDLASATDTAAGSGERSGGVWGTLKGKFGSAGGGAMGLVGKLGLLGGAALTSIGLATQLKGAWDLQWEKSGQVAEVTAALGLNAQEAKNAGDAASEMWRKGYGESISTATGAVEAVMSSIHSLKSASAADLADATERAQGFAQVFELDVSEAARNAGILIENGLAANATDAFDLMTRSLQNIPKALRGEVMDATQEYSQFFAQLGFTGADAMAMIGQAAATDGQYGIDKMGDAVKTFSARAIDGSKKTSGVYAQLGLDSEDMATRIAKGGDSAQGAMSQIVNGLLSIQDPAKQSQAAIALFGTPLEDLGQDELPTFLSSLAGTADAMDGVAGSSDALKQAVEANLSPIDSLQRSFQTTLSEALVPFVGPASQISEWAEKNPGLMQAVIVTLGVFAVALTVAAVAVWAMNSALLANPITWIIVAVVALIAGIALLATHWEQVWGAIQAGGQAVADWFTGPFAGAFTGAWDAVVGAIQAAWQAVSDWFAGIWQGITDGVTGAFQGVVDWISGVFGGLWQAALDTWFGGPLDNVRKVVEVFSAAAVLLFQAIWDGISAGATWLWDYISNGFKAWVDDLVARFTLLWDTIVLIWTAISDWLSPYVEKLTGFLTERWNNLVDFWSTTAANLRDGLIAIWTNISDRIRGIVQPLVDWATTTFTGLKDKATATFTGLKDSVISIFDGMQAGIKTAWDKIKEVFSAPVRWVADKVVNPLIRAFNTLADKVGMSQNKLSEWKFDGFAQGGVWGGDVMPGYTPGRDVHRFYSPTAGGLELSGGEAIMRPEWTRLVGGPKAVARMNAEAKRNRLGGFADGGVWWPTNTRVLSANYPGHTGVDIKAGMGSPAYAMTPGSITYTGWNRGFGLAVFQRLVNGMEAVYGHLSQSLVSIGQRVAGGQLIGRTGSTGNSSGPHEHVEVTAVGPLGQAQNRAGTLAFLNGADVSGVTGGGFDLLGAITSAFTGPLNKLKELGGSGFAGLVKALPGMAVEGMKSKLLSLWNGVAAGGNYALASAMALGRGWSPANISALLWLIQKESGGRVDATNPTSGAYGIPQALPGSKMASAGADWRTNPRTQITWMLDYILGRYGSAVAAKNWHLANNWYDAGGQLPPGLTLAVNDTGKTEAVLTAGQWDTAAAAIRQSTSQQSQLGLSGLTAEEIAAAVLLGFAGARFELGSMTALSDAVAAKVVLAAQRRG